MLCDLPLALLVWASEYHGALHYNVYAHITATPHTYVSRQHRLPPSSRLSCLVIRCQASPRWISQCRDGATGCRLHCRQSPVEFRGPRGPTTIRGFGIWTATCSNLNERDQHPAILHLKASKAAPHGAIARRRM
ncbi:hypothetical protein NEUTE1DRAFT_104844 [Neurospora tetrasperma FGSC 2508]|uniref:Uncharacterized protein n=1 Tax=Neurospora tetrasperma (strain FGSC 2508 / ATCC MYA-4615 / P0657) TaxID=510951 RepID=F8N3W2_NEUT8|nr:uncharacterized protein NEUTE1DRAFT_104844 [Neurospora tetrasperma FGSC 2508]EGO51812.1 hypothetical protein NEUTE1DRAFT_104844 [Neurospora tetrasperma FGSC 2508]